MRFGIGPRFASLFVTRKCNCRCPYCKSIYQPSKDIPTDQWKAIIDRLYGWGARVFTLTGGEPLMRPDILEIIEFIATRKRAVCWMISNFKIMTTAMIDRLHEAGLQFLTCSLDSLEGNGEKSDGQALDLLVYAKQKGIIASTLAVISSENIKQIPALAEEVVSKKLLFDMGLFQHVGGAFSPADKTLKPRSMDQVEDLRRLLRKLKIATGLVAPSWSYLNEHLSLYEGMGWKCSAYSDCFLVVNNDGKLMPCQEYPGPCSVLDIDDLHDRRWRESKHRTVRSCKGCFYGCYYQECRVTFIDALFDIYAMLKV
jgi:MoaA/NifB/PqqE/SkfB family radical SAM enzyme